jgi:LSD1 subclass zinc finger protein
LTSVKTSKWEPEARTEPEPRTEPEARSEPAPRTEPAARSETAPRTEPVNNKIETIKCPSCGYLLVYSKGTEKQSIRCTKCGNVFQVE